MLASAQAAAARERPELAAHLQHAAAALVCGADLCSAHGSAFAEHVASELQSTAQLLEHVDPSASALQPLDTNSDSRPRKQRAGAAVCASQGPGYDATASSGAAQAAEQALHALHDQRPHSVSGCSELRVALKGRHLALTLRMHVAALERAQAAGSATAVLQHEAADFILQALQLPAAPPCLGGVAAMPAGARSGRGRGRGRGKAAAKQVPMQEPASAAHMWATAVLSKLPLCGHAAVGAQLLTLVAAEATAAHIAVGEDRLVCQLTSKSSVQRATAALSVGACAVHAAQACAPMATAACHTTALAAALLGTNAVACAALRRGIGLANAQAALFRSMAVVQPVDEAEQSQSGKSNARARAGSRRAERGAIYSACAVVLQPARDSLEALAVEGAGAHTLASAVQLSSKPCLLITWITALCVSSQGRSAASCVTASAAHCKWGAMFRCGLQGRRGSWHLVECSQQLAGKHLAVYRRSASSAARGRGSDVAHMRRSAVVCKRSCIAGIDHVRSWACCRRAQ